MSESFSILIRYDVPYVEENIEAIGNACLIEAIKNWRYADHWSDPPPDRQENIRKLLAASAIESLGFLSETEDGDDLISSLAQFPFSPLSRHGADVSPIKHATGNLGVFLSVYQDALLTECAGDRESTRMQWECDRIREQRGESPLGKIGPDPGHPSYHPWWKTYYDLGKTPCVVEVNRKCFLRILRRLLELFPVKEVDCDEQLKEWLKALEPDSPMP
jgi:hypothetical protein